jgi:hypothetical protein
MGEDCSGPIERVPQLAPLHGVGAVTLSPFEFQAAGSRSDIRVAPVARTAVPPRPAPIGPKRPPPPLFAGASDSGPLLGVYFWGNSGEGCFILHCNKSEPKAELLAFYTGYNRLEVIDHTGRAYVYWGEGGGSRAFFRKSVPHSRMLLAPSDGVSKHLRLMHRRAVRLNLSRRAHD